MLVDKSAYMLLLNKKIKENFTTVNSNKRFFALNYHYTDIYDSRIAQINI